MSKFADFIKDNVGQFVCELDEASSVTFDGVAFPKQGWCVVLAGGPGSGKGFLTKNAILIDAKIHDVDELKKWYISAQKHGKFSDPNRDVVNKDGTSRKYHFDDHEYDFKNPADVSKLHQISNKLDLGDKTEKNFWSTVTDKNKPNVLFDITGREKTRIEEKALEAKKHGYKTSFVWVISSRDVALTQNVSRDRVVDQGIFHRIHNNIRDYLPSYIKSTSFADLFDEAWLLFASADKQRDEMTPNDNRRLHDSRAIKLEKEGGVFRVKDKDIKRVIKVLGDREEMPEKPRIYDDYETRKKQVEIKKANQPVQRKKPGLKDFLKTH